MPHSLQPHNTFFSLSMVVSNTKATTEKNEWLFAGRGGENSFLHCTGEARMRHNPAADQLKAPPTSMKLQHLQQPKTILLKKYRMWGLQFPSLGFVYFAGLCTLLIHLSDSFSWRIRAKEEAHWRHLGLLWEFSHVSILAIKYESWGNFSSRHSCHQDYFHVPRRLWIKCYTRRLSRRDIPGNSGLIHQLLFNHFFLSHIKSL